MKRLGFAALLLPALVLSGCVNRDAQAQAVKNKEMNEDPKIPVTLQTVMGQTVNDEIEVTGQMSADDDTAVSATSAGRLVSVTVRDGDTVSTGQVIAMIESADARTRVSQAMAQVDAARAQLQQTINDSKAGPARTSASVRAAEARVKQAENNVKKLKSGARDQDRNQAKLQVQKAQADLNLAKSNVERARRLFKEGAIAGADLEVAENRYELAMTGYRSALESQNLIENSVRPEDLAIAQQELAAAQEQLRAERATKTLDNNFQQRVDAARASLRSAQEQVNIVQKALADTVVRSPFSGRVSGKPLQAGTVVAPGLTIARIVSTNGLYFEPEVTESQISSIAPGTQVEVTVKALGGAILTGYVTSINPVASKVARLYTLRVAVNETLGRLKPGMFATGKLVVGKQEGVFLVPEPAVIVDGDDATVFIAVNGKAKKVAVKVKGRRGTNLMLTGLRSGDQVIVGGSSKVFNDSLIVEEEQEKK